VGAVGAAGAAAGNDYAIAIANTSGTQIALYWWDDTDGGNDIAAGELALIGVANSTGTFALANINVY